MPCREPVAQPVVDVRGLLDRVDAGDQRGDVDRTVGEQVQEAGQVAALGPANVAGRVVDALELVAVVVPARTVGPGEADVQFLVVVGVPRQVESGLADVHHPGPVPREPCGHLDRPVRVTAGGQQDVVRTQPSGPVEQHLLDLAQARLVGCGAAQRAGLLRGPAAGLDHVQAHDLDAGGDQEPDDELTDQPEPDHTGGLAERDLGAPDALHRDRPDRGERGVLGGNTVRHRDAQVRRYPVDLRVQGELVARGGDHLADRELLRAGTDLDHDAAQRVAERGVAVQPVHRLLVGGERRLAGRPSRAACAPGPAGPAPCRSGTVAPR